MRSKPCRSSPALIYMLSVMDFEPKLTISEVIVHAGLYLVKLDADRSPNAAANLQRSLTDRSIAMVKLKEMLKIVQKMKRT